MHEVEFVCVQEPWHKTLHKFVFWQVTGLSADQLVGSLEKKK